MKILKKFITSTDFWSLLVVLFFGFLASRSLFGNGYFNMHDDLQMMRQLQMEKCLFDLQIPCRWVPDMGFGFGYPLFNFYPPLPYIVGELFRLLGLSFVGTAKALFVTAFFVSGITMYYLAKEFFGRFGGVISAIFYIWAPYHSVDIFVRGAMNESWALIWFPAILWTSYRLIVAKKNRIPWLVGLALSWFALFTSHNLMVIVFAPVFALWCGLWFLYTKNWKNILQLLLAGFWSFGLAAFFTLPVLLEQKVVQTNTLVAGYYSYTAHFVSIGQLLFSRFWGYGPSVWLIEDRMSFQVGWLHWGIPLVLGAIAFVDIVKSRKIKPIHLVLAFALIAGWAAAFMTHPRSVFIWEKFEGVYQFVQFPWRFLTIVIVAFSFAAGAAAKLVTRKTKLVGFLMVISVLVYSWSYFFPENGHLGALTDREKFSGFACELQQTAGIYDYLPNTAEMAPNSVQTVLAEFMEGSGEIQNASQGTDWGQFTAVVNEDSVIRVNIFDFPGWTVYIDGEPVEKFMPDDNSEKWGRFYFRIPVGTYEISVKLHNTFPRTIGNIASLASWGVLGVLLTRKKK